MNPPILLGAGLATLVAPKRLRLVDGHTEVAALTCVGGIWGSETLEDTALELNRPCRTGLLVARVDDEISEAGRFAAGSV